MSKDPRNDKYPFTDFLSARLRELGPRKSPKRIARETGLPSTEWLVALVRRDIKLRLDQVVRLASALEVDAGLLLGLVLRESWRDVEAFLVAVYGFVPTSEEVLIIARIRELTRKTPVTWTKLLDQRLINALSI